MTQKSVTGPGMLRSLKIAAEILQGKCEYTRLTKLEAAKSLLGLRECYLRNARERMRKKRASLEADKALE
jgi:hypothetical protein